MVRMICLPMRGSSRLISLMFCSSLQGREEARDMLIVTSKY